MYVVYRNKVVPISDAAGNEKGKNQQVSRIGISGVDFGSADWPNQIEGAGAQITGTKGQADQLVKEYEEKQAAIIAEEKRQNDLDSIASNIRRLGSGGQYDGVATTTPAQTEALNALSAKSNFGSTELSGKVNFQVSDDQILNDYNNSRISTLRSIADRGNAQIAGITERLNSAQTLINQLPEGDPRRTSSEAYIKQLKSDLSSVQGAVVEADSKIKDFKPITAGSPEAASQITSFREYLQLPEERASQQLRQIDPDSYRTAVGLGQQYRQMATEPIGATTTPETEQIRQTIEDEALNQLRLGSTIGAEERRGYEQSIRAAQTARGNVFGLGPAVQEASQIGAAGEARKLARYGAAQSFLGSGQATGDALKADIAFRDALRQNRLGAAANFIGGGPSIYNLAGARTGQQQNAMQQYIQANQALPGGFNQQPSTAAPFYQAVDQQIPVQLTNAFNQLYRSQADYGASTYGAQVGALSRAETGSQAFGNIASGLGNLFSFSKSF